MTLLTAIVIWAGASVFATVAAVKLNQVNS